MNTKHNLLPQKLGLYFCHLSIGFSLEITMQRAAIDIFHNQEDLFVRFKSFIKLGQAFMINLLHDFDFSLDALSSVGLE